MKFEFLKKHAEKFNIKRACTVLKISRSGYYDYLHRKKSNRSIENEALSEIIRDVFHEHSGRYGARRIQKVLLTRNIKINEKRVLRLMTAQGLRAKGSKPTYRYYPNKNKYTERENILDRVFYTTKRNVVWVGDITYVPTRHGFLYLAVFIDIFSRKVVGWSMNTKMKDSLVIDAFYQAVGREHPDAGLLVHTDQGAQYTSHRFRSVLELYGCVQSMSRKGNPYDNAVMESFYRTLKRELVQGANYDNPEQAQMDIFKYIETYYNTKRIHSHLGWVSPAQFEAQNP